MTQNAKDWLWIVGAVVVVVTLLLGLISPAPAHAGECKPASETKELVEHYGLEHAVYRGRRAARFVNLKNASGEPLTRGKPNYVAVAYVPVYSAAYVGFGYGSQLCDKMVLPIATARRFAEGKRS
jgi:hypothetical protein